MSLYVIRMLTGSRVLRPAVRAAARRARVWRRTGFMMRRAVVPQWTASSVSEWRRGFHVGAPAEKVVPFKLSDIGEGIAEVEVLKVFVKPGDTVAEFDQVMEVQSDKATVEITSRYAGVVKEVKYKEGDIAPTGSVLMDIEVEGEAGAAEEVAEEPPAPPAAAAPPASARAPAGGGEPLQKRGADDKPLATPAVRRVARENEVDLTAVRGTGKDGRILKGDILNFVREHMGVQEAPTDRVKPAPAVYPSALDSMLLPPDRVEPIRGLKRTMVKTMTAAWRVPHFGYCDEVHMDATMLLRSKLKPLAEQMGVKFSYMPLMIKATSLALTHFPELNATTNEDCSELTVHGAHNIGIAMDSPRGLIVPNVKAVQTRTLWDIATELNRLQELAHMGKLAEEDLTGGTFTLSNIGTIGGTYASPVLMMPQVAIGAIGKVRKVPEYRQNDVTGQEELVPVHSMAVSWSADHRVVDGATMARFSNLWKSFLENPTSMLASMR